MSGGDEEKLPPVDHDPLNKGAVIKSVIFDIYYLIKIVVTSYYFPKSTNYRNWVSKNI